MIKQFGLVVVFVTTLLTLSVLRASAQVVINPAPVPVCAEGDILKIVSSVWACASAAGTGTVTSVAQTVPTGLSIAGSPITSTGTLAITLTSGYMIPGGGSSGQILTSQGASAPVWTAASVGTVTSVAASMPTGLSVSGSPITTSGTLAITMASGYMIPGGGTSGQVLRSQGASAPAFSSATYPATATGTGTLLRADGTNFVATTATYPATATGTGTILRADGTNWEATTATYPATVTAYRLLWASSTNVISDLATANSGVLVTSGAGVPSIATDIPTAVTIGGGYVYRAGGTDLDVVDGGTGRSTSTLAYGLIAAGTTATGVLQTLASLGSSGQVLTSGGAGVLPTWTTIGGTGTVTSVAQTVPTGLSIAGSPITTSGTLAITLTSGYMIPGGGTSGQVLRSQGASAPAFSTATYPSTATGTGTLLRADGANWGTTSATYPATVTAYRLLWASATNVISDLATANSGVLVTSGAGVPSIETDLPTAVTIGTAYVYRAGGTDIDVVDGGTGRSTSTLAYGLITAGTTATGAHQTLASLGSSGQVLTSGGAGVLPTWTTIGGTGTVTSVAQTVPTGLSIAGSPITTSGTLAITLTSGYVIPGGGSSGQILTSQGASAPAFSTATYPSTATGTGTILRADGTNWAATTATYPATVTAYRLLWASATNVVSDLATANSGVLVTSGAGVPSISTDIPTAVTIGSAYLYRAGGTDVPVTDGGTGASTYATNGVLYGAGTSAIAVTAQGGANTVLVANAGAPAWSNTPTLTGTNFTGIPAAGVTGTAAVLTGAAFTGSVTITSSAALVASVINSSTDATVLYVTNNDASPQNWGVATAGSSNAAGNGAFYIRDETASTNRLVITPGGGVSITGAITGGTYNSQTISSAASLTGTLAVAGALTVDVGGATTIAKFLSSHVTNNEIFFGAALSANSSGVLGYNNTSDYAFLTVYASAHAWKFGTDGVLQAPATVKIAGTANRATTEGTNHLDIFNGTAPVGTLANGISLYSASGELRVMDAAGNSTLLSPHDQQTNEWIYWSKDTRTGKVLRIDMERLMRRLDAQFGGGYLTDSVEAIVTEAEQQANRAAEADAESKTRNAMRSSLTRCEIDNALIVQQGGTPLVCAFTEKDRAEIAAIAKQRIAALAQAAQREMVRVADCQVKNQLIVRQGGTPVVCSVPQKVVVK